MRTQKWIIGVLVSFSIPSPARAQVANGSVAGAGTFTGIGSNTCSSATVIDLPIGPVGSPQTVTIFGNNSGATENDCIPPQGYHDGPVWWEAFRINQRANVTIDLCGTSPVQDPSYDLIYWGGCALGNQHCNVEVIGNPSGRGAPYCSDSNIWSTFQYLPPRTYYVPILSDPAILPGGTGPYELHIHAEACPGSCCHTSDFSCDNCADPALCTNPGDEFHVGQTCAQIECYASLVGPDLVMGNVFSCEQIGRIGPVGSGTVAMSCATTACNKGDKRGNWFALPDTDHPVIGINMYRMESVNGTTRFEQLGHSWLKHGFGSANADECSFGCVPGAPEQQIGVGCSDSYAGLQFTSCGLGPRSMIHPYTGAMPGGPALGTQVGCEFGTSDDTNYPSKDHRDHVHTPVSHKTQIQESDLDQPLHPLARYFAEGFYIMPHEYTAGNGNQNNNYSHIEVAVSGPDTDGLYFFSEVGAAQSESPAIDSWTGRSQSLIEPAPLVDGRAFLAWQATDLGGGQWHYEYAIYNMNSDASIGSLCIPLAPGVNVSNVGFHAPPNHAPEPHADSYASDPWIPTLTAEALRWDTSTFAANPMANAVRFGTLYNFRFDADVPPQSVNGILGLFKTNGLAVVTLEGPSPSAPVDLNSNGIPDACELLAPPGLLVDASGIAKSRFVSLSVPASMVASSAETALRVRLVSLHHVVPPYTGGASVPFTSFEGQVRWVGPPTQYVESSSNPTQFHAAPLQCTPHYQDWSTVGLLHVYGSAVVPSSVYEVENLAASCVGNEASCTAVSARLSVNTTRWGDVAPDYNPPSTTAQPDVNDIAALVSKFRSAANAPIKARALLAGDVVFGNITSLNVDFGFDHIAACVDGFRGKPYPYTIQACP